MTIGGNRYSTDESYELVWDGDFPIDGTLLWPKGRLLQLQWLMTLGEVMSEFAGEIRNMLILDKTRLTIARQGDDCPFSYTEFYDGGAYEFCTGGMTPMSSHDAVSITRLRLKMGMDGQKRIGVSLEGDSMKKYAYGFYNLPVSKAIWHVGEASIKTVIVAPTPRTLLTRKMEKRRFMEQLMCREIERQFHKAAPQAEIAMEGIHMPKEVFQRIVR